MLLVLLFRQKKHKRRSTHALSRSSVHDMISGRHVIPQVSFMGPTHPGLAASYGSRTDRAGLLVSAEDLRDATVRNSQLSRDYAGSDAVVGHLHYLVSDVVWQGPPVDEHAAQLVHPTLAQRGGYCATTHNESLKNNKNNNTSCTSGHSWLYVAKPARDNQPHTCLLYY